MKTRHDSFKFKMSSKILYNLFSGIFQTSSSRVVKWAPICHRPVHAKLSHSALSSRAHLGAGWELNFQLFGSSSSSVSMAPMEPNFQLWLQLRGSGSLRAVSLHKSTLFFVCVYFTFQTISRNRFFFQKFSKSLRWQRSTGTFCFSTTNVRLSEPELEMGAESRKFGFDRAGTGSRLLKQLRL